MKQAFIVFILFIALTSCGVYSLSGSTLPDHLKTVEIPLFDNRALAQTIPDELTQALTLAVRRERLKLVATNGDAVIQGTILTYRNAPHDYKGGRDNLDIKAYAVTILAEVMFEDNIKNDTLFNGKLTAIGVYDFGSEDEEIGRQRAINELVEKIIFNSLKGW